MSLSRLTNRSKSILRELLKQSKGADDILSSIVISTLSSSKGVSGIIIKKYPEIGAKPKKDSLVSIANMLKGAYYQASKLGHSYVGTEHLLLSYLSTAEPKKYKEMFAFIKTNINFPPLHKVYPDKKDSILIDTFSTNLTKDVDLNYREHLVNREEIDLIESVLLKKESPNPLLVGEPGVGKDSLVRLLVKNIGALNVPPVLAGYQVLEFDLMAYISSVVNKGNAENGFITLQEELQNLKRVILYIKNFQNLFVATPAGMGIPILYPIIKDIFTNSGVLFIACMSSSVFEKVSMDNDHLFDSFTVLNIEEPDEQKTKDILKLKAESFGEFHNITISKKVIEYIYDKADSSISNTSFPQKGVSLLDMSCAHLLVAKSKVPSDYKKLVNKTVVLMDSVDKNMKQGSYDKAQELSDEMDSIGDLLSKHEEAMIYSKPKRLTTRDVNIALKELLYIDSGIQENNLDDLLDLSSKIKNQLVGQEDAVDTVVKALIRARLGLSRSKRPIGSFLFLGPTGVGKTELAKIISKYAFGESDDKNLIRLDMSDFGEKHTVSRLVGSPPGYVGYNEGGELTSKIESQPNSVVLFDEIEKAHPDVLNILLQITEEGELSDAKGNVYDFSKSIIILTSNLGTEILHNKEIGFRESIKSGTDAKIAKHLTDNLKKILKPELLNRFDEIIVFKQLSASDINVILDLMLSEIDENLTKLNVYMHLTESAKKYLIQKGYSKEYGARMLRRTIEKELLDTIAQTMLENKKRPLFIDFRASKDSLRHKVRFV